MIILEIFLSLLAGFICIGIFAFLNILSDNMKEKNRLEEKKFLLELKLEESDFNLLDYIITREIDNFGKIHPDIFSTDGSSYIKETDLKDILATVTSNIMRNITPVIKEKIKLVYNFNNDAELITIIGNKAGLILAMLVSEVNSALADETNFSTTDLEL